MINKNIGRGDLSLIYAPEREPYSPGPPVSVPEFAKKIHKHCFASKITSVVGCLPDVINS